MIDVMCPADGRVVGQVPDTSPDEVARIAASLRTAQPAWEELGPAGRARHLKQFLEWLLDHEAVLNDLLQSESGKSRADTIVEIISSIDLINYYCRNAPRFLADRRVRPAGAMGLPRRLRVYTRPHPLVGIITPWNAPLAAPLNDGVPAMLAGAAVLFKPSEIAPLSWQAAVQGWHEIGCPPVIASITGGPSAGEAVVDQVDMIMFTGSDAAGRAIAARAGERLIPACLELGGKDAMVVLDDADLTRAAKAAAWGGMMNSGQLCVSVERIYVQRSVLEPFVDALVAEVGKIRQGTDFDGSFSADIGAMATPAQLARVEEHVADAVSKGATVRIGGDRRPEGLYFEPTVLVDVDHSMRCMTEETFGPTLPVMAVADEEEAIRFVNDSPFGLASSVWSRDEARADRVVRRVEAGGVSVNNVLMSAGQLTLPMGGWKRSGIGTRAGGANGMLRYCRQQAVVSNRISFDEPQWFPFTPMMGRMASRMARLMGAPTLRTRLGLRSRGRRSSPGG